MYKITYHFLSFLSLVLRKISLKNQIIISQHIASILFHYIPKRKNIAINNIKIAFPEKSGKWINNTLKNCYKFLSYNFIQFLAFPDSTNSIKIHISYKFRERIPLDLSTLFEENSNHTIYRT